MNIAAPNPIPSPRNGADRQQETTMDEILASIRRIITEDQASSSAPVETKQPPRREIDNRYEQGAPVGSRTAEDIGTAVDRLRRALDLNMNQTAPHRSADPHSFEPEIAPHQPYAQLGFGSARSGDMAPVRQDALHPSQARPSFDPEADQFSPQGRSASPAHMPSQAFERGRGQPQPQATFAKARAQRTAEPGNAEPRAHDYEGGAPGVPRAAAGSSGLLSSQTNASVAASFEALNQMLSSQNQETMESLTRQLMQPLLKQWLDDNLPTLVEKLVRAEIERVARGGRG